MARMLIDQLAFTELIIRASTLALLPAFSCKCCQWNSILCAQKHISRSSRHQRQTKHGTDFPRNRLGVSARRTSWSSAGTEKRQLRLILSSDLVTISMLFRWMCSIIFIVWMWFGSIFTTISTTWRVWNLSCRCFMRRIWTTVFWYYCNFSHAIQAWIFTPTFGLRVSQGLSLNLLSTDNAEAMRQYRSGGLKTLSSTRNSARIVLIISLPGAYVYPRMPEFEDWMKQENVHLGSHRWTSTLFIRQSAQTATRYCRCCKYNWFSMFVIPQYSTPNIHFQLHTPLHG